MREFIFPLPKKKKKGKIIMNRDKKTKRLLRKTIVYFAIFFGQSQFAHLLIKFIKILTHHFGLKNSVDRID